jgi:hypothetical protein
VKKSELPLEQIAYLFKHLFAPKELQNLVPSLSPIKQSAVSSLHFLQLPGVAFWTWLQPNSYSML